MKIIGILAVLLVVSLLLYGILTLLGPDIEPGMSGNMEGEATTTFQGPEGSPSNIQGPSGPPPIE